LFNALVEGMVALLNWLYHVTQYVGIANYGLAIILLTILIKLVLYPLTRAQMHSMAVMQQLQPRVKEIQARYGRKDPQKMQKAIMELYREHRVNPMAGCLPLLIQLPILFALYKALLGFDYVNPEHARFLWVPTLSGRDPYFILPLLAGVTTYWQSRLTTSPADATQRVLLITMPIFIAWISTTVPAGLALYWVVFSVVGAVQQHWINRQIPHLGKGVAKDEG